LLSLFHDFAQHSGDEIATYTRCGKLTSFFELSGLKRRGTPGGWAWSRSREEILKLCDVVVQ
jgi:hypothetical protein